MTSRLTFPPKNSPNLIPRLDRLAASVPLVDTERYILYPTDFSGVSRCAFELSCALARQTGRRLVVMHVIPDSGPRLGLAPAPPAPAGRLQAWETRLRSLQARDSSLNVEYVVTEGDPREEIFGRAQAAQCDLVVRIARRVEARTAVSPGSRREPPAALPPPPADCHHSAARRVAAGRTGPA